MGLVILTWDGIARRSKRLYTSRYWPDETYDPELTTSQEAKLESASGCTDLSMRMLRLKKRSRHNIVTLHNSAMVDLWKILNEQNE